MRALNYPVMIVSPNYVEGQIESEKKLTGVGEVQFENGCFEGASIIDVAGYKYEILRATIERRVFSIFNYDKAYRKVVVNLKLSEPKELDFEETKSEILDTFIQKKWYGVGKGIADKDELRRLFSNLKDFGMLINAL